MYEARTTKGGDSNKMVVKLCTDAEMFFCLRKYESSKVYQRACTLEHDCLHHVLLSEPLELPFEDEEHHDFQVHMHDCLEETLYSKAI